MKVLFENADKSVQLIEDAGVVTLSIDESKSIGGGEASGIVKVAGNAKVILDGALGLKLGEAYLNAHLPAAVVPLAKVIEGIANQAIAAIE